jgi:type IV secretory pathway TraG/TraD family ATPase VirD4
MGFIDSFRRGYQQEKYQQFKKKQQVLETRNNQVPVLTALNLRWFYAIIIFFSVWIISGGVINAIFQILGLYNFGILRLLLYYTYNLSSLLLACYSAYIYLKRNGNNIESVIDKVDDSAIQTQTSKQNSYSFSTTDLKIPFLHLYNTFRSILIIGGPGAGKSFSLIEPIIVQSIQQGFTGILYDYKFPSLASIAKKASELYSSDVKFFYINFEDFTRTHRVNPLCPSLMKSISYADEYANCIMSNLKPESIKNPTFWSDSAKAYLTSAIWFMREEYPQFCTLPHVISLLLESTKDVVELLSSNPETRGMVSSLRQSVESKADNQTAGVVSTLLTALQKIYTKEISWVLSGNDFSLDVNNPDNKNFVTLGNSATLPSVFAPVIALITTVATRNMNQIGKAPSAIILDEAPTLFIPDFEKLPAISRSYRIAITFAAQDISQIETMYGKSKKDAIVASLNSQFFGNVRSVSAAEYVVNLWGAHYVQQASRSMSSNQSDTGASISDSTSVSEQRRNRIEIQEVLDLKPGEFYVQLVESNVTSSKVQIKGKPLDTMPSLNSFTDVSDIDIRNNFIKIQQDVQDILKNHKNGKSRLSSDRDTNNDTPLNVKDF